MIIDLHSHTSHSDGELTSRGLVERAAGRGVTHLAVTDHDTVAGLAKAIAAGGEFGVCVVPGIEITAHFHGREVHILGHFIAPDSAALTAWSRDRLQERTERMRLMVERLQQAGVKVSWDDVQAEAGGESLGRPHLARALVRLGYVDTFQRAFTRYLSKGGAGYAERPTPAVADVCQLIRAAGGIASVAHPGANKISRAELRTLAELGLDAVETAHPEHPPSQESAYLRWAGELGLHSTGGSDFHGDKTGGALPGTHITSPASYDALRQLADGRRAVG